MEFVAALHKTPLTSATFVPLEPTLNNLLVGETLSPILRRVPQLRTMSWTRPKRAYSPLTRRND